MGTGWVEEGTSGTDDGAGEVLWEELLEVEKQKVILFNSVDNHIGWE